jgi:hypothetical protein
MAIRILNKVLEKSGIGLWRILVSSCRRQGRSESTRFGIFAKERDDVVVVYQRCIHDCWRCGIRDPVLLRTCLAGV